MQEIINIIQELRNLSGNAQLDYLKSKADNKVLKEVLQYTYDTNLVYKISDAKFGKSYDNFCGRTALNVANAHIGVDTWTIFKMYLDRFASQKGVKESEIDELIREFYSRYYWNELDLFKGILLKDLRINMGTSLFNKVWDDFSVEWAYMGCRPYNAKNLANIKYPAVAQTKMDGLYCNCVVNLEDETIKYISRQGKPVNIYGILDHYISKIDFGESFVLNGEIVVIGEDGKFLPREVSNGAIKRDDKTPEIINGLRYIVWDIIPLKDYLIGKWDVSYERRFNTLKAIEAEAGGRVIIVETEYVNSKEEALECFNKHYSKGEEGIVLKNLKGIWKDGKGKDQVKIKSEKDCDLQMVEFLEGKGTYAGMCGSIRCVSADGLLEVNVKPRTPADATYIWENQDECMRKILAVKYNEKIKSPDKELWSLYLPVFIEIRDDKSEADTLDKIS